MNQDDICRFICQELPRHQLQSLLESIEAAFNESDRHLRATYRHVTLAGPGPQSHHFSVQEALLRLPKGEGFEVCNQTTQPAGGHYALVRAGNLQLTTSVITMGRMPEVRDARFRLELRKMNERLEKQLPDLFDDSAAPLGPSQDSLHALLLPYTEKWTESDHSRPVGIAVAVPFSEPSAGFHMKVDVDQLWRYYDEPDDGLGDIAYPTLRDRMRDAENERRSEDGSE